MGRLRTAGRRAHREGAQAIADHQRRRREVEGDTLAIYVPGKGVKMP
jgi:hypothetical protein